MLVDKWNKAKDMIREIIGMIHEDLERLNRKCLEQICGFLIYVTRTYLATIPYLMGLHLMIDI